MNIKFQNINEIPNKVLWDILFSFLGTGIGSAVMANLMKSSTRL